MPNQNNYALTQLEDGSYIVNLNPPVPIGAMLIRYQEQKRFGGISGFNTAWVGSSGVLNGSSGITILNSGQGVMQITLPSIGSSGLHFGNYSYTLVSIGPPRITLLEGYRQNQPGGGV